MKNFTILPVSCAFYTESAGTIVRGTIVYLITWRGGGLSIMSATQQRASTNTKRKNIENPMYTSSHV